RGHGTSLRTLPVRSRRDVTDHGEQHSIIHRIVLGVRIARELRAVLRPVQAEPPQARVLDELAQLPRLDRKCTRLNSSHASISYAVFCLHKTTPKMAIR